MASDSLEVISILRSKASCAYATILRDIDQRSQAFEEVSFVHEGRQANTAAQKLVKAVASFGVGRHVWLGMPHDPNLVPMNILLNQ